LIAKSRREKASFATRLASSDRRDYAPANKEVAGSIDDNDAAAQSVKSKGTGYERPRKEPMINSWLRKFMKDKPEMSSCNEPSGCKIQKGQRVKPLRNGYQLHEFK
jgi:hypothetical protein